MKYFGSQTDNNDIATKKYVDDNLATMVPNTRTVNSKALSSDITLTGDDISDVAPLKEGPYLNASSASYRIFGHTTINTTTGASVFQFLIGCVSTMTAANQGLYLVEGQNRSSAVSIRITALRETGASNFTFGYYISNGEYYLGVYTSSTYATAPKIIVISNPNRSPWTINDSIAATTTQPSGWTAITCDTLVNTAGSTMTGVLNSSAATDASTNHEGAFTVAHGTSNKDAMLVTRRTDTSRQLGFGIGSGGTNAGIYDYTINDWIVKSDGSNATFNGNASTATTVSSTLAVNKGGTGATTLTSGAALIGAGTGAITTRSITNSTAATTAITGSTNLVTMNTLRYALNRTTGPGTADTNYSTSMMRAISAGTSDLTAGSSSLTSGAIYLVYEA